METWALWQSENFAGYQNMLKGSTAEQAITKFEKRTGIMADYAVLDESAR